MPKSKSGLKRPIMNIENISSAIEDIETGMTIEMAAKKHMVAKTTLWRYYKKHQIMSGQTNKRTIVYEADNTGEQVSVFSDEEEIFLAEYIKTLSQLKYDLSRTDIMRFAYIIAYKNQKVMPTNWSLQGTADQKWLDSFLRRHPHIPVERCKEDNSNKTATSDDGNVQIAKELLGKFLLYNQIYNYLESATGR